MSAPTVNIQQSLAWPSGKPVLPGITRRIYYICKEHILQWPTLAKDTNGRPSSATYTGSFTLAADTVWQYIDVLPDKCQVTSEAQNDAPSQLQLNKLSAVHAGIDAAASAAAAYLNNNDNVFIVQDMNSNYRVIGSPYYPTKTTVSQDLGQGPTGTPSTTITAEASDLVPAPFYSGTIALTGGNINAPAGGGSTTT